MKLVTSQKLTLLTEFTVDFWAAVFAAGSRLQVRVPASINRLPTSEFYVRRCRKKTLEYTDDRCRHCDSASPDVHRLAYHTPYFIQYILYNVGLPCGCGSCRI